MNAANPGYCATDLNQHSGFRTAEQGAEESVQLATLPEDGPSGVLWGNQWTAGSDSYGVLPWWALPADHGLGTDPNGGNAYPDPRRGLLGARQRRWLIRQLRRSRATWKVIANDLPLGLVVSDGSAAFEGVAQGDPGAPAGRDLEFAEVLAAAHRAGVTGIVHVHYTAAHHYDPARAAVGEFTPFWEFVSGPAHASGFGPNQLDGTFGPEAVFVQAPPTPNTSPADGFQHFGEVAIDGESAAMTVNLRDQDGGVLWSVTLPAG